LVPDAEAGESRSRPRLGAFRLAVFSQGPTALDSFQLNEPGATVDGSVAVDLDIDGLSNPRADIGISYTHLSADAFGSEVCTGLFSCDPLFVDGTGAPNTSLALLGNTFTTRVRGESDVLEIPLSLTTELASFGSGPNATVLTGSVGAAYARIEQSYQIVNANLVLVQRVHTLNEDVTSDYFGPTLGGELAFAPAQWVTMTLGADIAALYVNSSFQALQTLPWNNGPKFVAATDSDGTWGARTGLSLGAQLDLGVVHSVLGGVQLGLEGSFTYWSQVAQIINPSNAAGPLVFPNAPGLTNSAGITYADMTSYGLTGRLSVPLDGP